MKDKLLKCPFCGGKTHSRFAMAGICMVTCENEKCGAIVSFVGTVKRTDVERKFNKRIYEGG